MTPVQIPTDQAVRDRALAVDESFIVQAPAGSGKTELLIRRYLNLLAHVSEPEEIVAITFTRKAAAEMRERIIDALRHAGRDDRDDAGRDAAEAARLSLARAAMANDRRRGWELVSHPARLQIQTIDALCLSLSRRLPYLSGFAAPSGILDDARGIYRRAATETVRLLGGGNDSWRDALQRFLFHVDNDMVRATDLLAAMLASRDQWLRYLGDERLSPEHLEAAWRNLVEAHLQRLDREMPASLRASMVDCANAAAVHLAGSEEAAAWLDGNGFPAPRIDQLPRWRFLAGLLITQSGQWREQIDKRQGFPPHSEAKPAMQALLAALAEYQTLPGMLNTLTKLPAPRFDPEQAAVLQAMVTVLKLAVAQLQVIFEETAQVDFVEITQRANHALGVLEAPSDLALKLDYQIQHLLVDEFQDTSIAQYHLLRLLTQGWTPDDGRTLFLVGDPMQSIYRFREAEVGVFLRVWERGLDTVPVVPLRLTSNFRSGPGVVEWINQAFADCFPALSDSRSGAVAYSPSTPQRSATGDGEHVHVHPFTDCSETVWADRLAALTAQALERSANVAVLVRARPHLRPLLPALRNRNVPFTGMEITALIDEPAVRDLYSLTRALLHPADRMAWLALLRAPWCGLRLADLVALAGESTALMWNALREPGVLSNISDDGRARLARFEDALQGAMTQRGRLPLRQWVQRAWVALDGPALVSPAELGHVHTYFELLGWHQDGMNLVDENAFAEALGEQWAHAEARSNAVQLMTIHRAKGLEFDEVFLPALEHPTRADDKPLLLWEESADAQGLLLATVAARGAPENRHYRYLRALQAEKSRNEDDRLFYVACTRARDRLHLLASPSTRDGGLRPPARGSLLHRIWPRVEHRFADTAPGPAAAAPDDDARRGGQMLRRVPLDWFAPACPDGPAAAAPARVEEQQVEFSWVGETARHVGVLVHELIERIATDGLERWNAARVEASLPVWREQLHHIGVPARELDGAVRRAADAIRSLLEDGRAAWLLRGDHDQAADELELSVLEAGRVRRLRMDRTFVDADGVRWIVDYKTSAHEGGAREAFLDEEVRRYREQMESYAAAFRKMENRDIRLGLYFPLLQGWREWPYPD